LAGLLPLRGGRAPRDRPSLPTRRSSDLPGLGALEESNLYSREQWGLLSGLFCVFPEEKYKNIWRAEGFPGWRTARTRTFLTPGTGSGRQLSRKWRRSIPGQWSI